MTQTFIEDQFLTKEIFLATWKKVFGRKRGEYFPLPKERISA
jgi:hypothetical protein